MSNRDAARPKNGKRLQVKFQRLSINYWEKVQALGLLLIMQRAVREAGDRKGKNRHGRVKRFPAVMEILEVILRIAILDCARHGLCPSPNRHLNGAANFDEWPADISKAAELPIGPF